MISHIVPDASRIKFERSEGTMLRFYPNEYYYHLLFKEEQMIFDAKHDWVRVISFDRIYDTYFILSTVCPPCVRNLSTFSKLISFT